MSDRGSPRPSQVTVAGGMGIAGALIFVLALFDTIGATHSVTVRDSVAELLGRPPWQGTGVTVDEMMRYIRIALLGMGAAAAVAFVLGFYVFKRSNAARIGFTIAAVFVLPGLTGTMGLGLASIMMATAAIGLWSEPARDWFAGRSPRPRRTEREAPPSPPTPPAPSLADSHEQPPPSRYPYGAPTPPPQQPQHDPQSQPQPQHDPQSQPQPPPYPPQYPPPYPPPYPPQYPPQRPPAGSDRRPASVLWAVILTWVTAGVTALMMGLALVVLATSEATFRDRVQEQLDADPQLRDLGVTTDQLMGYVWGICILVLLWSLAAAVIAVFALRRAQWARILLAVSAACAALLSLVAIVSIVSVLTLVPAVVTVVLLFTRSATAWYSRTQHPTYYQPQGRNEPW